MSDYVRKKAEGLVRDLFPNESRPLVTASAEMLTRDLIASVIEDCVSVAKPLGWIGNREELRQHFYRALAGPTPTVKT